MDSRQQFEEWITKQEWFDGCSIEHGGLTDYIDPFTYSQWVAWQASRELIVIDLPEGFTYHGQSDQTEYVFEAQSVVDEIHSAGIRTK